MLSHSILTFITQPSWHWHCNVIVHYKSYIKSSKNTFPSLIHIYVFMPEPEAEVEGKTTIIHSHSILIFITQPSWQWHCNVTVHYKSYIKSLITIPSLIHIYYVFMSEPEAEEEGNCTISSSLLIFITQLSWHWHSFAALLS